MESQHVILLIKPKIKSKPSLSYKKLDCTFGVPSVWWNAWARCLRMVVWLTHDAQRLTNLPKTSKANNSWFWVRSLFFSSVEPFRSFSPLQFAKRITKIPWKMRKLCLCKVRPKSKTLSENFNHQDNLKTM